MQQTKNKYIIVKEDRPFGKVVQRTDVTGQKRDAINTDMDDLRDEYGHECKVSILRTEETLKCFKRAQTN